MFKPTMLTIACVLAVAALPARADQCTTMMTTTTTMCLSGVYSAIPNNKFTTTFGPGNAFSGIGVSKTDRGLTFQGTYACQGNNFYTTSYTASDGEQNYWLARFPNTIMGSGSQGIYFTGKLKGGACP
jgi:hypothetical protein